MYWNRTATGATVREEMPLSSISRCANASAATEIIVNPGTSTQITSTCCTPPPSYHNINLPLGHPSTLTNERGAPPSYEEAIDPNGTFPSNSLFASVCPCVQYAHVHLDVLYCQIHALFPAPPPSYDSLFGRMREARKISKGIFDFLKNIIFLLLGTSKS